MALRDYLATEVGEDWIDGLINRREAVRRLVLLGLTVRPRRAAGGLRRGGHDEPAGSGAPTPAATASAATARRRRVAGRSAPVPVAGEAIMFAGPRGGLQTFLATARSPGRCWSSTRTAA